MKTSRRKLLGAATAVALMCFGVLVSSRTAIAQQERPARGRTERIEGARGEGREAEPGTEPTQRAERIRELERQALKEIQQRRPEMLPKLKELKQRDERAYHAALRDIAVRAGQARIGQQGQWGGALGVRGVGQRGRGQQSRFGRPVPRRGGAAVPGRGGFRRGQVCPAAAGSAGRMGQRPALVAGFRGVYRGRPAWRVGRQRLGARRGFAPSLQGRGGPAAGGPGLQRGGEWGPNWLQLPPRAGQGGYRQLPRQSFGGWNRGPAGGFPMAPQNNFRGGGRWFAPRPGF